jgi:hypothetical protein
VDDNRYAETFAGGRGRTRGRAGIHCSDCLDVFWVVDHGSSRGVMEVDLTLYDTIMSWLIINEIVLIFYLREL